MTAPLDAGYDLAVEVLLTDLDVIRNRAHRRALDHYSDLAAAASVPSLIGLLQEARAVLPAEYCGTADSLAGRIDDALGRRA